ncbi:MAG: hypothetical protein AAF561_13615 [Planctomycetota bacterium]
MPDDLFHVNADVTGKKATLLEELCGDGTEVHVFPLDAGLPVPQQDAAIRPQRNRLLLHHKSV